MKEQYVSIVEVAAKFKMSTYSNTCTKRLELGWIELTLVKENINALSKMIWPNYALSLTYKGIYSTVLHALIWLIRIFTTAEEKALGIFKNSH